MYIHISLYIWLENMAVCWAGRGFCLFFYSFAAECDWMLFFCFFSKDGIGCCSCSDEMWLNAVPVLEHSQNWFPKQTKKIKTNIFRVIKRIHPGRDINRRTQHHGGSVKRPLKQYGAEGFKGGHNWRGGWAWDGRWRKFQFEKCNQTKLNKFLRKKNVH